MRVYIDEFAKQGVLELFFEHCCTSSSAFQKSRITFFELTKLEQSDGVVEVIHVLPKSLGSHVLRLLPTLRRMSHGL